MQENMFSNTALQRYMFNLAAAMAVAEGLVTVQEWKDHQKQNYRGIDEDISTSTH